MMQVRCRHSINQPLANDAAAGSSLGMSRCGCVRGAVLVVPQLLLLLLVLLLVQESGHLLLLQA